MYSPMLFNPCGIDLQIDDQQDKRSIRHRIAAADGMSGAHPKRDLRHLFEPKELNAFAETCLQASDQLVYVADAVHDTLIGTLSRIEDFSEDLATQYIAAIITREQIETAVKAAFAASQDVIAVLLKAASELYYKVETEIYVQAMTLNLEDYKSVFPDKVCVHDPTLVLKRLRKPGCKIMDAERKQHFAARRSMSFGILTSMSIFEVDETAPTESMKVLLNAGRYQTQRLVYDDAAESVAAEQSKPSKVQLDDELNDVEV